MQQAGWAGHLGDWLASLSRPALSPNRGGYTLTMRECQGSEEVLAALAQADGADLASRLHVGWGSFRNLDIAAARRSAVVVLLDVNRHQFAVWDAVRAAVLVADDPASFIDAVLPRLPREPRLRQFADDTGVWLRGELERPGSWLHAESPWRYAHLRDRARAGAVLQACVDLRDGAACADLATALQDAAAAGGLLLDTLYLSNIPWMLAQPLGFFGEAHPAPAAGEEAATPVIERVHAHVTALAAHAHRVVHAMQLRADADADNLQWLTECVAGPALAGHAAWRGLGVGGP